jgi:predicted N-acyltransferase
MPDARVVCSIHEVGRERWNACFGKRLEAYDYLAAVEEAGLAGFDWRYVLVEDDGRLLAAAPAFFTDYGLETTLTDFGRGMVAATRRLAERAFTVRLASLGSPCTEDIGLGFHPNVTAAEQPALLSALVTAFEAAAADSGCWLLALKDAPHDGLWPDLATRAGYQAAPGMPGAELTIDFPHIGAYLAGLSAGTRKDMRRKLKSLYGLRIERRRDVADLEDRMIELYRQTRQRADMQFEDLTPAYFTGVLRRMGERAFCTCYFADGELLAFNLLLQDDEILLDKFFCMETERGPAHNLYFLSWFTNVQHCLDHGLTRYQSGQAGYATKLRLGSWLAPTHMYFRHRRPLVNRVLRWAAPMLADDPAQQRGAA